MKIKEYFSVLKKLDISRYRVIHSFKTAFACLFGLGIESYYGWPSGHWIPITTVVVMSAQTHFGGTVHKAFMRFLGTFIGVFISVAALWLFGDSTVMVFCTIFFSGVVFAYIASSHGDISYAGTLGVVTVLVILTSKHAGMEVAIQRGFYITVGIIIALLVSRFIFPIHARDRLRYHVAVTLRNLSRLYFLAIQLKNGSGKETKDKAVKLNAKVENDIVNQPRLIHEAVVGSRVFAARKETFDAILDSEQSLSRLINLMYVNLREAYSEVNISKQLAMVVRLHKVIGDRLVYLADCFEMMREPPEAIDFNRAFVEIDCAVEEMSKLTGAQQLIVSHSFLFFMKQILKELERLGELIAKVNGKSENGVV